MQSSPEGEKSEMSFGMEAFTLAMNGPAGMTEPNSWPEIMQKRISEHAVTQKYLLSHRFSFR